MTWESIVLGALQGFSSFVNSFVSLIGGSINAEAREGLIVLFAIGIFYRICQGGVKIPNLRRKDEDDEDEWEYIRVKRRR